MKKNRSKGSRDSSSGSGSSPESLDAFAKAIELNLNDQSALLAVCAEIEEAAQEIDVILDTIRSFGGSIPDVRICTLADDIKAALAQLNENQSEAKDSLRKVMAEMGRLYIAYAGCDDLMNELLPDELAFGELADDDDALAAHLKSKGFE